MQEHAWTNLWSLLTRISGIHHAGARLDQLVEFTHEDLWHTPCRSTPGPTCGVYSRGSLAYTMQEHAWTNLWSLLTRISGIHHAGARLDQLVEFTHEDLWHTPCRSTPGPTCGVYSRGSLAYTVQEQAWTKLWSLLTRISGIHSTGASLDQVVEFTHEDLWHTQYRNKPGPSCGVYSRGSLAYTVQEQAWTNLWRLLTRISGIRYTGASLDTLMGFTHEDLWHTLCRSTPGQTCGDYSRGSLAYTMQ